MPHLPPPRTVAARRLRRAVAGVVALLTLTSGTAWAEPLPATATSSVRSLPLLWEGRVIDGSGAGVVAHVHAVARPPASAIPTAAKVDDAAATGARSPAPPSIPLASAVTGPDGRFALRALPPVLPPQYTPDGWIHVMLWAQATDGSWAVATDSVRFVGPGGALRGGAWLSTFPGAERAEHLRSMMKDRRALDAAIAGIAADELAGGQERPLVMAVAGGRPAAPAPLAGGGKLRAGSRPPGEPYTGCTARYVEDRAKGMRTIADIDVGSQWSYRIDYEQTRTTSWDVGYERSAGQWKVAGTSSFSNRSNSGFNANYGPYRSRYRESYQVELVHARILWRCGSRTSPGPFHVRTVEAQSWTHGTYNQGEPVVGCRATETLPVAGNTYQWRKEASTSRYSASGAVLGFSGRAAVTYTRSIRLGWKNHVGHPRYVCGESGDPYLDRTRVTALD